MKAKSFFAFVAAAFTLAACTPKNNEPKVDPVFEVTGAAIKGNKIEAKAEGANVKFTINSNLSWEAKTTADWLTITPASAEGDKVNTKKVNVEVVIAANTNKDLRKATIELNAPGYEPLTVDLTVEQAGFAPVFNVYNSAMEPISGTVEVANDATEFNLFVQSNMTWSATSSATWADVTELQNPTAEALKAGAVKFSANTDPNPRETVITITPDAATGVQPFAFTLKQSAPITIALTAKEITFEGATITAVPSNQDVHYFCMLETPSYVKKFNTPEELMAAELAYWYEEYGSESYPYAGFSSYEDLLLNGICDKGSSDVEFKERNPETEYICYAFAIDDKTLQPISDLFTLEVTTAPKPPRPQINVKYEDYLGQWTLGTSLVTIEQKVAGESYNISGLLHQSYPTFGYEFAPVEAKFENGWFTLAEQITGVEVNVGTYGACDVVLSGEFSANGKKYKYFPFNGDTPLTLFAGAFDGNKTINVEPEDCPYGTFEGMCFAWVIKSGANKGKGNYFDVMPIGDMVKYEKPTGPTPEGQWYCASVTDYWGESTSTDWTMTIEQSGIGYKINNFDQGFDEFLESQVPGLRCQAPTASWNASAKTLTVAAETETGISAGTNLYWTGLNGNDEVNIVLAFDFDKNTCAYTTPLWGAFLPDATDPGFYTLYNGPDMVFTKVNSATHPLKTMNYMQFGGKIPYNKSLVKHTAFDRAMLKTAKSCKVAGSAIAPKPAQNAKSTRISF